MDEDHDQSPVEFKPVLLGYAGFGEDRRTREPSLPGPALRVAKSLAALSAITLPGTLLASGLLFLWCPFVGVVLAGTALIAGIAALHRNTERRLDETQRINTPRLLKTTAVIVLLLFLQSWAALATLGRTRDVGKSTVSSANLRGIGFAISLYHEDSNVYPDSLDALLAANLTSSTQYWSPNDPGIRPGYSSFAYLPGEGPHQPNDGVVFCFEKRPWTPRDLRLFPEHCRMVLFADGSVSSLNESDFRAALARDRQRRAELGWPVFQWDEETATLSPAAP